MPSLQFERVISAPARDIGVREVTAASKPEAAATPPPPAPPAGSAGDPGNAGIMRLPSLQFERPPMTAPRASAGAGSHSAEESFVGPPSLVVSNPLRPQADPPGRQGASAFRTGDSITAVPVPLAEGLDAALVLLRDPYSKRADAYRTLRRKLASGSARIIAVTSASPREGKTTCAINLALALSETARDRVLIVEANIRAPGLAAALKLETPRCFTEQLRRHRENPLEPWLVLEPTSAAQREDDAAAAPEAADPPAGNPGAAEAAAKRAAKASEPRRAVGAPVHVLAVSARGERPPMLDPVAFSMGLESLKRAGYDYIIVDTPPVLGSMDMNVISDSVDGILLTSFVKRSTRKSLRLAIEQLKPAPVLGVVLLEP